MKFGHLVIAQNESRRISGKKQKNGSGKSGSRECVKIKIKGVDKKTLAAISPYRRRFEKFKKGFGARLICFQLLIEIAPDFDKM